MDEVFRDKITLPGEFAMIMAISFHYFCLTLIQCSFNVALLNIGTDCNLLIKNVISISYIEEAFHRGECKKSK